MRAEFHRGTADVCFVDHSLARVVGQLASVEPGAGSWERGAGCRQRRCYRGLIPPPPPNTTMSLSRQLPPARCVTPEVMLVASRRFRTKAPSVTPSRHRLFLSFFLFFVFWGQTKLQPTPPLPDKAHRRSRYTTARLARFRSPGPGEEGWGGGVIKSRYPNHRWDFGV